ncbi:acyl-CoA dehydrogenase family protein [Haliea sp.]|uniref:acyl-CoA dehydrogenase family protein n=1 Tax=Haliea TaxID=475794 RepID=UPI000C53666C|nr:acyl-CoA dehydrogenase family protein [Haliea sp.]HAN67802.1 acyl-CoA dehydrogenase [Halieaceae bacterium]MAD64547.1 acyl-CoA dehydrogenase [Haliea sp.]MAY93045.1 acyl-CoA dehydrogenase [Haliea sp.]MBK39752.1 acyl-CoA dehydrogenase [Haliea sp.]MBP69455.1 acyl-CoA dehydrogenase [Haliea sp.]
MSDLEHFRADTRAWLEENCPAAMREPVRGFDDLYMGGRNPEVDHPDQQLWCERMAQRGWTVPQWPREYGGGGLNKEEAKILQQEMARLGARRPLESFGISMLGPALLKFGSEAQKQEHLPPICRGEIRWCQGYSEPNAGSDLASLQTRAEDRGDHYIINGQKVWTSYADKADWIFCLVRTDNTGSKHEGISFVLFDMASEGVTTRPIKLISGSSPFCETFFDNVRADKRNLVGEEGKGWAIAKYLLTHEREMISAFGAAPAKSLGAVAVENLGSDASGRLRNGILRHTIAQYQLDALAFGATMSRVGDEAKAGQGLGAASSIFKYYGTELNKRRNELNLAIGGERALGWDGDVYDGGATSRDWLRSKGNSIEGGTSEVQLNIIAKRVLGLPD